VYERLRSVRKTFKRDTSLVVASPAEIKSVTPFLINVAFYGIVLYDENGYVSQILDRIRRAAEKARLIRYRAPDGKYGWKTGGTESRERMFAELAE